uniref:Uncharacterized protein n=1 Tax=Thermofilum pendens TaxID=2269 RepID=A0A7C4BAP7_THEPE
MKNFHFTLKQADPINNDVTVTTVVFRVEGANLVKLSGSFREFTEEDFVDFDREIGAVVGITVNDLFHGASSVRVEEIAVQPPARLLKVVKVEKRDGKPFFYLVVTEVLATGEERVLYANHRSLRVTLNKAVGEVSRILGIDESIIWNLLK